MKKKLLALSMMFAMTATMLLGSSASTVKAGPTDTPVNPATAVKLNLNKRVKKEGATYPSTNTFKWTITPVSFTPASASVGSIATTAMPALSTTKTNALSSTTVGVAVNASNVSTVTMTKTYPTAASSTHTDFQGQFYMDIASNQAIGVYTYEVTEVKPTGNGITYDQDTYYMNVYVTNQTDENGVPTGNSTISNITTWKKDGSTTTGSTNDGNTPDNGGSSASTTETQENNDAAAGKASNTTTIVNESTGVGAAYVVETTMYFTNEFSTKNLTIKKNVVGNYASKNDTFTFKVKVTDTSNSGANFDTAISHEIGADTTGTITEDTETTYTLKHGDALKIEGLSSLATYKVEEVASAGDIGYYRTGVVMTSGHQATASPLSVDNLAVGSEVTEVYNRDLGDSAVSPAVPATNPTATWLLPNVTNTATQGAGVTINGAMKTTGAVASVGTGVAKAAGTFEDVKIVVTNEKTVVTPTGILLMILPYALAVLAVIAIVVLFVVRKKKTVKVESNTGAGL